MKIQLACDYERLEDTFNLLEQVSEEIDIIEVGTDLMFAEGVKAVSEIKKRYPNHIVLSDMKVMDGGKELGELVYKKGADIFTVLGVAPKETIQAACHIARQYQKQLCVDMMCVTDLLDLAKQYIAWGADYLCIHTADDQKEHITFHHYLEAYCREIGANHCSIAGGMNPEQIKTIKNYHPEIIVVGGYITQAKDPLKAVKEIKEAYYG